jgi:hypothetical protein
VVVGVAHREGDRGRPREQRQAEDAGDDRAVVGPPDAALDLLDGPVVAPDGHGDAPLLHLARLAVDEVGGGRAGHEGELERGEAERGRDGVAPGHPLGGADQDDRDAEQRAALDVDDAGDRQVGLVEALAAGPREVGVAEHHPRPVGRRVGAEAVGVRADAELLVEPLREPGRRARAARRSRRGPPGARRGDREAVGSSRSASPSRSSGSGASRRLRPRRAWAGSRRRSRRSRRRSRRARPAGRSAGRRPSRRSGGPTRRRRTAGRDPVGPPMSSR